VKVTAGEAEQAAVNQYKEEKLKIR